MSSLVVKYPNSVETRTWSWETWCENKRKGSSLRPNVNLARLPWDCYNSKSSKLYRNMHWLTLVMIIGAPWSQPPIRRMPQGFCWLARLRFTVKVRERGSLVILSKCVHSGLGYKIIVHFTPSGNGVCEYVDIKSRKM